VKHLTLAEKDLLVGDVAADLLVEYAVLLGQNQTADKVDLNAISSDGDAVVATFLLNGGTSIVAETTRSSLPEPDNEEAVSYMRQKLDLASHPPPVLHEDTLEEQWTSDEL
jgi:hypothetical protein